MSKSSQRNFSVRVTALPGVNFSKKTGAEISASVTKAYDGGSKKADVVTGPAEVENITVGKVYDPVRDEHWLSRLRDRVGEFQSHLVVTPLDRNQVRVGDPVVYDNWTLIRLKEPDHDSGSSELAEIELEFAGGGVQ